MFLSCVKEPRFKNFALLYVIELPIYHLISTRGFRDDELALSQANTLSSVSDEIYSITF